MSSGERWLLISSSALGRNASICSGLNPSFESVASKSAPSPALPPKIFPAKPQRPQTRLACAESASDDFRAASYREVSATSGIEAALCEGLLAQLRFEEAQKRPEPLLNQFRGNSCTRGQFVYQVRHARILPARWCQLSRNVSKSEVHRRRPQGISGLGWKTAACLRPRD